jgi:hypothetical protein
MFGGNGGVGKTTCAVAAALQLARTRPRRRLLFVSTDPAHSLADVLQAPVSDAPRQVAGLTNLDVRELDASGALESIRTRYRASVDAVFDRVVRGSAVDVTHDRIVIRDLLDLARPGLDELAAVLELVDLLGNDESPGKYQVIVMDTAPTGHAVRLLQMPETVHEWTRMLMRILLKYQPVVGIGELGTGSSLTRSGAAACDAGGPRRGAVHCGDEGGCAAARRNGAARSRPATPSDTGPAIIVNAMGGGDCDRCRADARREAREIDALVKLTQASFPKRCRDGGSRRGPTARWPARPRGVERSLACDPMNWVRHGAGPRLAEISSTADRMTPSATYVYCVVQRDRPIAVSRMPQGIPGSSRPALLQVSRGLSIVVSDVPLDAYGPERIERRLHDLDWVASIALAHEAVVERVGGLTGATVIPMKLFTLFSEPERAVAEMRSRRRQLWAVVRRIRDCQEWGVRVTRSVQRPQRPARTGTIRSGAAFLAAKRQARDAAHAQSATLIAAAEGVLSTLGRVARKSKRRLPPDSATTPPVLEAAFLVPRNRNVRFKAAARQAASRCRAAGGDLALTGPWPAYNFVDDGEPRA